MTMKESQHYLMPGDAFDLLIHHGYHLLQVYGYREDDHPNPKSYTVGVLVSRWLALHGINSGDTQPSLIPQAIWAVLFPSKFRGWHLLSDDLTYAFHLAWREAGSPGFLAGEVLRRRRSPLFRWWRKLQRQAEWARQRIFHGDPSWRIS